MSPRKKPVPQPIIPVPLSRGASSGRLLENVGFLMGIIVVSGFGAAEAVGHLGMRLGDCGHIDGIPWGIVTVAGVLCMPKMFGKVTAGQVWIKAAGVASRVREGVTGRGHKPVRRDDKDD